MRISLIIAGFLAPIRARTMDETLIKEYFHLQEVVEEFDSKSLTIKAWSVSLSMTGIGAAYSQDKPIILFFAGISALLFWLIEGLWKTFQYAYYARIKGIENHWAGNESEMKPLQIAASWSKSWHEGGVRRLFRILLWPHVFLPHAVVFLSGVVAYLFKWCATGV